MITLIKLLFKFILKFTRRILGFTVMMAMGPGILMFLYLFEPHKPLPQLIIDLPSEPVKATLTMQGRVDRILIDNSQIDDLEEYLRSTGFQVDSAANKATYHRRHFKCTQSYSVVWTEKGKKIHKAAALYKKRCQGSPKD